MKEIFSHRFNRSKKRRGHTAELAAQLAPLEEQSKETAHRQSPGNEGASGRSAIQEYGAIVVDSDNSAAAREMMEAHDNKGFFGMEPVVLVILGVMLLFTAFIAWQISHMPVE
jgi:hypothetical protein